MLLFDCNQAFLILDSFSAAYHLFRAHLCSQFDCHEEEKAFPAVEVKVSRLDFSANCRQLHLLCPSHGKQNRKQQFVDVLAMFA